MVTKEYHVESSCETCGFTLMFDSVQDAENTVISQESKHDSNEHFGETLVGFFNHDCKFTDHFHFSEPETVEITP